MQYLTHDGDAVGAVSTSSAPTNTHWNQVLQLPWRRGTQGDWLDANQAANGATPYASSFPLNGLGRVALPVTTLVQRWLAGQPNKGFYLRSRVNAWPLIFAGRVAPTQADRPVLTVVTSQGSFALPARCNASFASTASASVSRSDAFTVAAESFNAILQFDLSAVSGTLTSATLGLTLTKQTQTGAVLDVLEADPPAFVVPESVPSPVLGLAADLSYAQLSSHPNVLFNGDMRDGGWSAKGFENPVQRLVDTDGATYASTYFDPAQRLAAAFRYDVSKGTGLQGAPDLVRDELFARYWLRLGGNFGSTVDANKIPGVGVQFGWWNPVGYWQQTTGNGGSPGTGLKVWNTARGQWEYQGHSIRLLVGPKNSDVSAYDGLFYVALYPYNLDQQGAFPASLRFPYLCIRRGQKYWFDIRCKQNTMSGTQDADGNWSVANADGIYQVWINGYAAFTKTDFRWRRHAEFGVQGLWVDWFHGGQETPPNRMDFDQGYATLATQYIGPPRN